MTQERSNRDKYINSATPPLLPGVQQVKVLGQYENPIIVRVTVTTAATEQSYTLPDNTKKFYMRTPRGCRRGFDYTYTPGGDQVNVANGEEVSRDNICQSSLTIYLEAPENNYDVIFEIWK